MVELDGKKHELEHHIDFTVSWFKPKVVKWYVEIREYTNKL